MSKSSPFESIYARLATADGSPKIVGVTSPARGEGTTTIAVGIARAASGTTSTPVLLIDAAPAGRRAAKLLRAKSMPLTSLAGEGDDEPWPDPFITTGQGGAIDVLTLERGLTASTDAQWSPIMDRLRSRYSFVVADLGDLGSPTPLFWQNRVDEILLVVDTTRTTVESLSRVRREMQRSGLKLGCFVLNKRRFYVPQFLYRFVY